MMLYISGSIGRQTDFFHIRGRLGAEYDLAVLMITHQRDSARGFVHDRQAVGAGRPDKFSKAIRNKVLEAG